MLNALMTEKASTEVANTYVRHLQAAGKQDIPESYTLETLKQKEAYLKTQAGRMARFVSAESVQKSLQPLHDDIEVRKAEIVGDDYALGKREYNLEQAVRLAEEQGKGFMNFLACNQNFLLFAQLLQARVGQGIPAEESTNQRIFARLQSASAAKMAQNLFHGFIASYGDKQGIDISTELTQMDDEQLRQELVTNYRQDVVNTLKFEFDDERLGRYMSLSKLKEELANYAALYQGDSDL